MNRLTVSEWFLSLQGEGVFTGTPVLFLRLAGCNLRCSFCDTRYAWDKGEEMGVEEVSRLINQAPLRNVVITGGEPLLQAEGLLELISTLDHNKRLHLETNGTRWEEELLGRFQMVTLSPKLKSMAKEGLQHRVLEQFHRWNGPQQVKLLVRGRDDWDEAEGLWEKYPRWGREIPLIFQPLCAEDNREGYLKLCIRLAEEFLEWTKGKDLINARFLPQLHKVLWWGEVER